MAAGQLPPAPANTSNTATYPRLSVCVLCATAIHRQLERIQKAGGWVTSQGRVNGNLNLSRALGDLKYKGDKTLPRAAQVITAEPDIMVHALEGSDEFLILACDGVWDVMSNQQAVDFVGERIGTTPLSTIAEQASNAHTAAASSPLTPPTQRVRSQALHASMRPCVHGRAHACKRPSIAAAPLAAP